MAAQAISLANVLPTEVLEYILGELPTDDLEKCKLVCSRFAAIIQVLFRRYNKALVTCSMKNCRGSAMPLRMRIDMLRRYHRAWERLSLPFGRGTGKDGIYPLSSHTPNVPPPLFLPSGWLSIMNPDLSQLLVKIPTFSNLIEPRHNGWWWAGQLFSSQLPVYVSYRFDPSQDLLILISAGEEGQHPNIHVRSLSTGLPHPLAQCSLLEKSEEPIAQVSSFRVFGSLCVILARSDEADEDRALHIWDWKTGELLYLDSGFGAWGDVISIIDDRTVLVAHDECLQLLAFDADGDFRANTLEFPRIRSEALQIWTTVSQPYAQAEPGRAFAPTPASEIVIVNMVRQVPDDGIRNRNEVDEHGMPPKASLLLVIKVSALLAIARADGDTPLAVPWHKWGPNGSRFIEVPATCSFDAPTTFGSRALISYSRRGVPTLGVLDVGFDAEKARGVSAWPACETSPDWGTTLLNAPVTEDWHRWFEDEDRAVTSNVPCRLRLRRFMELLPRETVGSSLYEAGLVVNISNQHQCDCMTLPLVT